MCRRRQLRARGGSQAGDAGRLFAADRSAIPNAMGGQDPTNTGRALALRTADHAHERYLGS